MVCQICISPCVTSYFLLMVVTVHSVEIMSVFLFGCVYMYITCTYVE